MRSTALLLLLPLSLLAACDSCSEKTTSGTVPSASVVASASASAPPAASSATLAPSGKMAHCPNAVTGAATEIEDVPGGVEVSVTSNDATAMADIRARVQALVDAQKNANPNVKHNGQGEGGGLLGRCPIVLKDTTITVAELPNGSKMTVVAKDPEEVDWLRRETRDREEDLKLAGSPAGTGKMAHCPSAIAGVTTTLKNTKDGVSVILTANDEPTTKSIRQRVAHLIEISKAPDAGAAAAVTHTGEGGGGGSIGRCPVVLQETSLTAKDIPHGSQVDVKANKTIGVAMLQAEAKERAAKFQLPVPGASGSSSPAGSGRH